MAALRPQIALREIARLVRSNVLLSAANFVTSLLLARLLGAELRGEYAFVILWCNTLATCAIAGLPLYLSRLAARMPEAAGAVYGMARRLAVAGTLVGWIGLIAFIFFAGSWSSVHADGASWTFAALMIPLSIWMALQLQIEVGRGNLRTWIACLATFAFAQLSLLAALAAFGFFTVHACLAATLVAAVLAVLHAQVRISRTLPATPQSVAEQPERRLASVLHASRRDNLANWLALAASSLDRLIVSLLFPPEALADYVVLLSLAHLQNLVCEAIAPAMFADVARLDGDDPEAVAKIAGRLRQTVLLAIVVGIALAAAMPVVVPLVYGAQYGGDFLLICTVTAALSLRAMMRPFEEVLRAKDRAIEQSLVSASVVGCFFVFCVAPALLGNLPGVALGMLLANMVGLGIMVRAVARRLHKKPADLAFPGLRDVAALVRELRPMG